MAHHFISYSSADGLDFARDLADALEASDPSFDVWLDRRMLEGGDDWDSQIVEAIKTCDSLLFILTPDSVEDESVCKQEWSGALKYKKPIIPLKFHSGADLPFRLGNRQYIDFTQDYKQGLARLRTRLQKLASPVGQLQALKDRLADANRDLRRASSGERTRIEAEIEQLQQQIAEQQRIVDDPKRAENRTEQSIKRGIERERFPEKPATGVNRTKFINPPPVVAPAYFQGRTVETNLVAQFLADESTRVITMAGRGGIGKTALICRLLKSLEGGVLPEGGELTVDGIVYLSANGTRRVNLPNIFADLSQFLPQETATDLDTLYKNVQVSTKAKMQGLLEHFPGGHYVVLLDNFEDVIDSETQLITDAELAEALVALLEAPHHGVKLIITTRILPQDLIFTQPGRQGLVDLDEGLPSPYAENILRALDIGGRVGLRDANPALLDAARQLTQGYPRALEALFTILAADRSTTLQELLADSSQKLPENVVKGLVGEAFSRLDPLAQQVMQALAIYGRPVTPIAVDHLLQPYARSINSAPVLNRLVNMRFVSKEAGRYHLHPVDREYALSLIPEGTRDDRKSRRTPRWTQIALLDRGADYFEKTRKPRTQWKTLDDLAPQLAEFELRYASGDYETAARVLSDINFDYLFLWGYYRLLKELHERLEGKLFDPRQRGDNLSNLGNAYDSLGDYKRAIDYQEQSLAIAREIGDRQGEGVSLGSLGGTYGSLGDYKRAIDYQEQSLAIAREIGDRQGESVSLGNLGSTYDSLGDYKRAIDYQEQSLAIAREIGDRQGEGSALGSLGSTYDSLGDYKRAIDYQEQSLAIAREIGDRQGESVSLGNLGSTYDSLGDYKRAIDYQEQSLAIAREIGDRQGEGSALGSLGLIYFKLGNYEQASYYHQQRLTIAGTIGDQQGKGIAMGNLAEVLSEQGRFAESIQYACATATIAANINSPYINSYTHSYLARTYLYINDLDSAQTAVATALQYDDPQNNHNVLALLGIIALRQSDSVASREAFVKAIAVADLLIVLAAQNVEALYAKALAISGLVLIEGPQHIPAAIEAYQAARKITTAAGIVARAVRLLDALRVADEQDILKAVRAAAAGEE